MSLKVIYFKSIFLIGFYLKKTDLCAQMLNNSPNCYATGNSRERGYCSKRSRNWLNDVAIGEVHEEERTCCSDALTVMKNHIKVATTKLQSRHKGI